MKKVPMRQQYDLSAISKPSNTNPDRQARQ
jgi:hypothetical protein